MDLEERFEQINSLSGLELDAEVSRVLFGREVLGTHPCWNPEGGWWEIYTGNNPTDYDLRNISPVPGAKPYVEGNPKPLAMAFGYASYDLECLPDYSTTATDGWETIIARFQHVGFEVQFGAFRHSGFEVQSGAFRRSVFDPKLRVARIRFTDGISIRAEHEQVGVAVCRAALMAVAHIDAKIASVGPKLDALAEKMAEADGVSNPNS